ncbi:MAG: VWA domain-containing protein, partial [Gammaproteobacteria bacterium]
SLTRLMGTIRDMNPPPDNFYWILDPLPTQGDSSPLGATVDGRTRLELFGDAIREVPAQVPVNVILFPMEGDPMAAAAYWNLARTSGGSFISPSRDWP